MNPAFERSVVLHTMGVVIGSDARSGGGCGRGVVAVVARVWVRSGFGSGYGVAWGDTALRRAAPVGVAVRDSGSRISQPSVSSAVVHCTPRLTKA